MSKYSSKEVILWDLYYKTQRSNGGQMNLEIKLIELQRMLKKEGILISFSGRFSQGIIEELGDAIKKHMEAEDYPRNEIYNVFAIFVEQTHNIKNYATRKQGTYNYEAIAASGIVTIGKTDKGYFVSSGNLIELEDAEILAAKIEKIKDLDKQELKQLYKEQMKKEIGPGSTGAGVGLIDIARKASKPIAYSLETMEGELAFFTLTVVV